MTAWGHQKTRPPGRTPRHGKNQAGQTVTLLALWLATAALLALALTQITKLATSAP
jgi:hypothetical protein